MFVCVARLTLQIPDSGSLKAKRQILRRVTDRVKARFNVAVAEVDENDIWQRATIALAVVSNDQRNADEQMGKIIHFVEEMYVAPLISRESEMLSFGDQLYGSGKTAAPSGPAAKGKGRKAVATAPDALDPLLLVSRGDRSLAEAEGMGDWENRHEEESAAAKVSAGGKRQKKLSLDDARVKARSLRNPRDWETK